MWSETCVLHLFAPAYIHRSKGGMHLEPDLIDRLGAAVPGGVHGIGGCRGVFAAAHSPALHPAHLVRYGGGHHAGSQRVEPAAARYRARPAAGHPGLDRAFDSAGAGGRGPFAAGAGTAAAWCWR